MAEKCSEPHPDETAGSQKTEILDEILVEDVTVDGICGVY